MLQIVFILGTIGGCGSTNDKVNISSENNDLNALIVEESTVLEEEFDEEMSSEIEEEDNLSSYTKAQIATEEYCLFEGTWEVIEYLDGAVEYHGIDVNDEEYIRHDKEYTERYKEKYLGKQLVIGKDTLEMFGPLSEMGYYSKSTDNLFFFLRQPLDLEIVPPFVCAHIILKDDDEGFYMICDDNGRMLLDVGGNFFELEKQESSSEDNS